LIILPETFETFCTSSENNLFTSLVAKFFLEQLLRKICDISPDVSKFPSLKVELYEGITVDFLGMNTLLINEVLVIV